MTQHPPGASAPIDLPCVPYIRPVYSALGAYYVIEASEEAMRASGLIFDGRVYPSPKARSCRNGAHEETCSRLGDGRLRLKMGADLILSRDKAFKRLLGEILADTQFSLVKGEEA